MSAMRFALILLAASIACGQESNVAAGAKIFRSHCGECHGLRGEGGRGPTLASGVFYHGSTDADLMANISDGIPGTAMPGIFFSPVQVKQIVAYVRSLAQNGAQRPPGDPAHGEKLFREKGCIGCHITRGEGGFKGPDLTLIGSQRSVEHLRESILDPNAKVTLAYWVAKITLENGETYTGFLRGEGAYTVEILDFSKGLKSLPTHDFRKFEIDKTSIMPSYKGRLDPGETDDLVAYLWSLKRPGGTR
jgi:putative heme-binding domain-containing protein